MEPIARMEKVLYHQNPDKIPRGELAIADELVAKLLGINVTQVKLEQHFKVRQMLQMDIISFSCRNTAIFLNGLFGGHVPEKIDETKDGLPVYRDGWGTIAVWNENNSKIIKYPINTIEDAAQYEFPALSSFNVEKISAAARHGQFFTMSFVGGIHETLSSLVGFSNFMNACVVDPKAIKRLAARIATFNAKIAARQISAGSRLVIIGDDLAYKTGTFLSPFMLRELIFPYLKLQVAEIKKLGVPVFLHSDGNINKVLEDIVDTGFDGLNPLEPAAGVDICKVKENFGDRLVLMGNIDISGVLAFGTPDEVRDTVRETIKVASPDGGYILSSSNMLTRNLSVENVTAMYQAAEEFGHYQ